LEPQLQGAGQRQLLEQLIQVCNQQQQQHTTCKMRLREKQLLIIWKTRQTAQHNEEVLAAKRCYEFHCTSLRWGLSASALIHAACALAGIAAAASRSPGSLPPHHRVVKCLPAAAQLPAGRLPTSSTAAAAQHAATGTARRVAA
jgi:hypothetical protein